MTKKASRNFTLKSFFKEQWWYCSETCADAVIASKKKLSSHRHRVDVNKTTEFWSGGEQSHFKLQLDDFHILATLSLLSFCLFLFFFLYVFLLTIFFCFQCLFGMFDCLFCLPFHLFLKIYLSSWMVACLPHWLPEEQSHYR